VAILYKDPTFLARSDHVLFDAIHDPGTRTPASGVYRCVGCGKEATSVEPHPLPPQNHHQHTAQQGRIRWQLVVWG
jgi:hypothetical protein